MTALAALVLLIIWMSAIWVLVDSGRRDLSESFFHSRWSWAFAVLVLWLAVIPLYLTDRAASRRASQTRRYPLGHGQWTSAAADDGPPREELLSLWEGVDPADMDRITRRALKRAGRQS